MQPWTVTSPCKCRVWRGECVDNTQIYSKDIAKIFQKTFKKCKI